jgi:hypothetical protein
MADTTNPLPSITEPLVDRYRRWNPIWYRFIKPLIDTVRSNGVSIEQLENSYTISVNQNGRVIGSIKLDGTGGTSTFAVLADKFVVINPSNNADGITAFVVGNVNGTPTVGINGNLIVDDTILARHLDVASLSSITANIGTVTTGRLQNAANTSWLDLNTNELVFTA